MRSGGSVVATNPVLPNLVESEERLGDAIEEDGGVILSEPDSPLFGDIDGVSSADYFEDDNMLVVRFSLWSRYDPYWFKELQEQFRSSRRFAQVEVWLGDGRHVSFCSHVTCGDLPYPLRMAVPLRAIESQPRYGQMREPYAMFYCGRGTPPMRLRFEHRLINCLKRIL